MHQERLAWLRRNVIAALCSDDELMELLVLKGGNALDLIHGIGGRTSIDLDYSLEHDFPDPTRASERLEKSLARRFGAHGYVVIDFKFEPRPPRGGLERLSGYHAEFKLVSNELYEGAKADRSRLSREAEEVAPRHARKVEIQVSKHEYCVGSAEVEVPGLEIPLLVRVYTPEMIVAEKLRSLCQQMPEYRNPRRATARARDFYDIHAIVTARAIDTRLDAFHDLVCRMFRAKDVPLELLGRIEEHREFHRADWPAVETTVRGGLQQGFDFYFDFVLERARGLAGR